MFQLIRNIFLILALSSNLLSWGGVMESYKLKDGSEVKIESLAEGRLTRVDPLSTNLFDKTTAYYAIVSPKTYRYDHYTGVATLEGKIIISPKYKYVRHDNGCFIVTNMAGFTGVVDKKGKTIIECKYDRIYFNTFSDTDFVFFKTEYDGAEGIVTAKFKNGKFSDIKEIIPPSKYADVTHHGLGFRFSYSKGGGLQGYMDFSGKTIIAPDRYTDIVRYPDNRFVVKIGNRAGVCDANGKEIFFTDYNDLLAFQDSIGAIRYYSVLGNSRGEVDYDGSVISEPSPTFAKKRIKRKDFTYIELRDERGNVGTADTLGNTLIPPQYDHIYFHDGLFYVVRDGYRGVHTLDGKTLIPATKKYHFIVADRGKDKQINSFRVWRYGFQGLCDSIGNELVAPDKWTSVSANPKGYLVRYNGLYGMIDKNGQQIVPCAYHNIMSSRKDDYHSVKLNGLEGLVDTNGNEIVPPEFESCTIHSESDKDAPFPKYVTVKNGEYQGIYSLDGNVIFPVTTFTSARIQAVDFSVTDPMKRYQIKATDGDRVCFFDFNGNLLRDTGQEKQRQNCMNTASELFSKQKWSAAFKQYEMADKIHSDYYSTYNMGICKYNDGKYNEAIAHLNRALNHDPDSRKREKILDIIDEARDAQNEKEERRMQIFASVFSFGMNLANDIYNINQAQQQRRDRLSTSRNSSYSVGASGASSYDNSSNVTDNNESGSAKQKSKCTFCGGTGSTVEYTANYGNSDKFKCDDCGKMVTAGHYHRTCTHCGGSGMR